MLVKTATFLVLAAFLTTAACGGGGTTGSTLGASAMNPFEQELAGTYVLKDFALIQSGVGGLWPSDFETWDGQLVLSPDRNATLKLDLRPAAGGDALAGERHFTWRADAGWIFLTATDAGAPNAMATWQIGGMGALHTEFAVPVNRPDCAPVLLDEGQEAFDWVGVD